MLIPTGTAQINWSFTGEALPHGAQVTLGVAVDAYTGTPADAAADARDAWDANLKDRVTAQITLSEVLVKFGPNATGPSAVLPTDIDGTATGEADSPNVAYLIHKVTEFGGRTGRGRMYLPGVPSPNVFNNGLLSDAWRASTLAAFSGFYTDLTTAGLFPLLLHGPDSPVTTPLPITDFVVDARVATQRRRLRR